LYPEGPATGNLDQGFPWFSSIPEQILSCPPPQLSRCSACFTCSPTCRKALLKFSPLCITMSTSQRFIFFTS
jgi:hypothetical protein